eukprot:gnl/TRDRNA2_/TRDRNA2_201782_c0_seq1.p1 gnl/TRDRNA2_/TRDRNA2_201782_c0~~gnl/TRDRNA2_/TRDRNA2_201782_c0_seq1.p1  ORF type:complete len:216 (+),score=50.80 gnl/TRDRNA2_/TRDRNA2_201782_c0_seq1:1-648(+)
MQRAATSSVGRRQPPQPPARQHLAGMPLFELAAAGLMLAGACSRSEEKEEALTAGVAFMTDDLLSENEELAELRGLQEQKNAREGHRERHVEQIPVQQLSNASASERAIVRQEVSCESLHELDLLLPAMQGCSSGPPLAMLGGALARRQYHEPPKLDDVEIEDSWVMMENSTDDEAAEPDVEPGSAGEDWAQVMSRSASWELVDEHTEKRHTADA